MSIIYNKIDNTTKIIVENIEKQSHIDELVDILCDKNSLFEINFINIQAIPKDVVIKLNEIKNRVKIFTNEATLKSYLMNLGFELQYENAYEKEIKDLNLEYIAIGGSAGSLKRFISIIKELPKSNLSVFIIMHQKADTKSSLANILQTHTEHYKVVQAKSDMKIEPSTIYTAPPGYHMIVAGGFIFLTDAKKRNFSRPSISTSFESLSNEYKNTLLAILVCGYGADGSDSLDLLQKNNTTVLIQKPEDCEAKPMLNNAIESKNYDHILSIEEMNGFILSSLCEDTFSNDDLVEFLSKIYKVYGYDYRGYNLTHIRRRVHLFYSTLRPKDFNEFEKIVLSNKNIFKDLFLNISVNITTFFRNPEVFKKLREEIIPKLDSFMDIKIWCAGCSSGEEPYSIAIFLKELGLLDKSLIYATDINEVIIKNAQNGLYDNESYHLFLKHYYQAGGNQSFSKYFNNHDNFVEIKDEIKEKVLFFRHNLALDKKINDFQLIFCRNVIIYFDNELKNQIFELFRDSLDNYGFLVLGESESLDFHSDYKTIDKTNKIYKRKI